MPRFAWWLMVAGVTAGLAPLAGGKDRAIFNEALFLDGGNKLTPT